MSREVTHTADRPYRLTPDDIDEKYGDVAVCLCGLSEDRPFCDGSHNQAEGEEEGVRYKYVDGERRVVELTYVDDPDDGEGDPKGGGGDPDDTESGDD
ncbi:CDGSH iron-sulfur domain-containing protein [Salinigranum sp.]|uniref:CDGSH iron-sulfur domain-containing protein n=1 Tax=Salinigranum sp. TaxID=1966351 RepID=UPI003561E4F5